MYDGKLVVYDEVALLAEGVDRNWNVASIGDDEGEVALLAEGVDRNRFTRTPGATLKRRPPRGGRG